MASPIDSYGDIYIDICGAPAWKPLAQTDKHGRHVDYDDILKGRDVVGTALIWAAGRTVAIRPSGLILRGWVQPHTPTIADSEACHRVRVLVAVG
jgi:hypothetical protein